MLPKVKYIENDFKIMSIFLLGKKTSYFVDGKKDFHSNEGMIKKVHLKNARIGKSVKTNIGESFYVVKPSIIDFIKHAGRLQQVILPKDAGMIIAETGVGPGSKVIDVGTGSGWLSMFLAYHVKPGKVYTYETDERAIKIAKENFRNFGFKNIIIRKKDASKGIREKNADLVTIDVKFPERIIPHAFKSLKIGGWISVYSPHIEEVKNVRKIISKFEFSYVKTLENIVREWQYEKTLRPKTVGLVHTGWLTFARKLGK